MAFARLLLAAAWVTCYALHTELQKLNDLMEIGEVVHRAFTNRYDVQLGHVTSSDGRICASSTPVSVISRQFFEDSWTTIESISGAVEAMFNAQQGCFMKYAGQCETYAACADGSSIFDAQNVPLQGLFWAGNHTKAQAWQLEALALLEQLPADLESELSQKLRADLQSAAGFADEALGHMRSLLQERLDRFNDFVDPATALAPNGGAAALPSSLLSLAVDLSNLLTAAPTLANSNCGNGWLSGPAQDVAQELDAQDDVFSLISADDVMQLSQFDYLRRAVEALMSGAALALQVASFAALAEFHCEMKFSPQTAVVSVIDAVQDAVNGVLVKLRLALPAPSGQDAATPLRRCLAERVQDAEDRLPQASTDLIVTTVPLLSLDFCGRLFNVTARELLAVTPYAGDVPFTSPTELFATSGEQRHVRVDLAKGLSLLGPFAGYVDRSSGDTNAFTVGDQVLQLQAVQEMTVRAAKAMPEENQCSVDQKNQLMMQQDQVCNYAGCDTSCDPGCFRRFSCEYGTCSIAAPSLWADGETEQVCDPVTGNYYFYAFKWPNSSCAFVCQEVDQRPVGRSCQGEIGYWSPVCNNSWHECDLPAGMTASQFTSVANFTTAGRGASDGCEITLAFVAAKPPAESFAVASLTPPFTVETFVNISLDAIPTGASSVSSMAILFGSFPSWYLALRYVSAGQAQLVFYHSRVTLASHISAEDSTIVSSSFSWDNSRQPWRHLAVTVTQNVASRHNVFFYVDGSFVSSGYRSVAGSDILESPFVSAEHRDVFHVGPVNMKRFPAMLTSGRPYYDLPMYTAQLDEVRIHQEALDTLTLGSQITELRRLAACNTPYEQRDGSACHARPRLTPPNTTLEQTLCLAGYELCQQMPGICIESCAGNMLRQEDCSCDCPPSYFQTWLVSAIHLTGSGDVKNATVYDAAHQILGQLGHVTLPRRLALAEASQVAVVSVWGGSSATSVSLEVETPAPESLRLVVPGLRNVPLQADRPSLLHHQAALDYDDPTLSCAQCPGEAPRSVLPRTDTMSCRCASGYGADLLGKCVPAAGPLQAPVIDLANGTYHTAGTRVRLSHPPQDVEGPWLLAIRYEYGTFPDAPNCDTSPKYEELEGQTPGLDIIRRQEKVTLRAVLCHPLHQISLESVVELFGNDHMNPPRCVASGNLSTSSTYALEVQVELLVDQQPDASIFYEIQGFSGQVTYASPFLLTTQGVVTVTSWAEKLGFDSSSRTSCSYTIDGQARLSVSPSWPDPSPLLGYSSTDAAFLVARNLETFAFVLDVPGVEDTSQLQLQFRLWRGSLGVGAWSDVPESGAVVLQLSEQLEAPNKTTLLQIDWRLKEPGYVWTSPDHVRLLVVRTRSEVPSIRAEATVQWQLMDHWTEGPQREVAMRQTHTVQLVQPNPAARVLFSVRAEIGQVEEPSEPLLTMNPSNFTSLTAGAAVERFVSSVPGASLLAEDISSACGGSALQVLAVEVPKLCDYLGTFQVLGGAVVTAYAIVAGELESAAATLLVPKELEPSSTDLTFQALAEAAGNVLSISSEVQVLPSISTEFTFSVGQPDAERQSCVLATTYSYFGSLNNSKGLADCTWLPYNGPRKLTLQNLLLSAEGTSDLTLNVTVLTTVRRPGYLWSYPLAKSFLWLKERTPLPKVLQILEPGGLAPKAMVWLQEGQVAECFFTLHYEPLELSDVPFPFLVEVPSVTASVGSFAEAFRPTAFRSATQGPAAWRNDVDLCAWPQVCELPMNGTLPAELIAVPAGYSRLCAWSLWQGFLESAPACELLSNSQSVPAAPSFAPSTADVEAIAVSSSATVLVPEQVGTDQTLRLELLGLRQEPTNATTNGRRLSAESMPLFLPRTHPLQYRWAAAALDSSVLMQPGMTQSTLTANMLFSPWTDLGLAAETPLLPLPNRQSSDHVLVVVDVRLLTGVNRWSAETRTAALLMLGTEPAPSLSHVGRNVLVDTGASNSSIYFKWLQGDIMSSFGTELIQSQVGVTSIAGAFAVHADAMLHGISDASLCTVSDDSATSQRQFCMAEAPLTLSIPSTGRWTLWTLAHSAGLGGSPVTTLVLGQMCIAPMDVAYAMSSSCVEGPLIESGTACTAACQLGYSSSVSQLLCTDGVLMPPQFACAEDSCTAPSNVSHAAESSCLEGNSMAPGGRCTAQCSAGYAPSISSLSCSRGRLSPSTFSCGEAECEAPEVVHAASPSCSGLPRVKSRESCSPQCQDGYVASQNLLQCVRGKLDPESFICEPGVNVDVGVVIASVPSTLLAGSLALMAAYCIRSKPGQVADEKEASDPLKEWWQCVQEVEPGICVFCGKEPEELETRYEDHGPGTLFRSCNGCAALLGFEVDEDAEEEQEEELLSTEDLKVDVDGEAQRKSESEAPNNAGGANDDPGAEQKNMLPRPAPPAPLELGSRGSFSRGSISDAVKGLQENFLSDRANQEASWQEEVASGRPASPRERPETEMLADMGGRELGAPLPAPVAAPRSQDEDSPQRSFDRGESSGRAEKSAPVSSRRSQRERVERMSLADWQDSPDERLSELREPGNRRSDARQKARVDRTSLADWQYDREPEARRMSTQDAPFDSRAEPRHSTRPSTRRYEDSRRSRRDGTQETRYQDWSAGDDVRSSQRSRIRSSRHRGTGL